jgi:hypothetical protein
VGTLTSLGAAQGQNPTQASNNAAAEAAYQAATGQVSPLESATLAGTSGQPSPGGVPLSFWAANGGIPSS